MMNNEQWLDNALIAIAPIERSSNPLSKFGLLTLPVGATTPQYIQVNFRNMTFTTEEQAEGWIGRNLPNTVIVKPEDLAKEIASRKQPAQSQELLDYPPREVTAIERLSWGL